MAFRIAESRTRMTKIRRYIAPPQFMEHLSIVDNSSSSSVAKLSPIGPHQAHATTGSTRLGEDGAGVERSPHGCLASCARERAVTDSPIATPPPALRPRP